MGLPKAHIRTVKTSDVFIGFQELPYPSTENRPQEDTRLERNRVAELFTTVKLMQEGNKVQEFSNV